MCGLLRPPQFGGAKHANDRKRQGRCYELALRVMLHEPSAERLTLVHGRISQIKNDDYLIDHAWIELNDGRIYDPVLDKHTPQDEYVRTRGAVIERQYPRAEAIRVAVKTGHYGPWHRAEQPLKPQRMRTRRRAEGSG